MTARNKKILKRTTKIIGFILFISIFVFSSFILLYFQYDKDLSNIDFNSGKELFTLISSIISSVSLSSLLWIVIFRLVKIFKKK